MAKMVCDYCKHVNPHGTILCESCGKPLQEDKTNEILTMRYEGSARRSQTYKRTLIDKIWNYFSSVKVGVLLIVLVFIASALGTIFPQSGLIADTEPETFYEQEYGILGKLYYEIGFHELYGSWWFIILIALLGLSVIVASIDRGVPLYRALKNQSVNRHDIFLKRQRVFGTTEVKNQDELISKAKENLQKKRYKVKEENGNIFAEKGRFSRWGAYVNHCGLILVMIGAMLRFFPGMYFDDNLWVREGDTERVPGTNGEYYIENHKFILETYDEDDELYGEAVKDEQSGMLEKNFQTNATLYKTEENEVLGKDPDMEKVKDDKIQVNHPLKFGSFSMYQSDYTSEFDKMTFSLENKESEESYGTFTIDLIDDQKDTYDVDDGYKVDLISYFPDFYFDENDEPATKSSVPNNPAFIFDMYTPETPDGEISFVGIQKNADIEGPNQNKVSFEGIQSVAMTGLTVHKDHTLWIIIVGGFIFMVGVVQGLYWQYRRIWLKRNGNEIWLAGTTFKNWYGLKSEMSNLTNDIGLNEPIDQLDQPKKPTED